MKELFVPYELALLAKEKGFNEPCINIYYSNGKLASVLYTNNISNLSKEFNNGECCAPLYQHLVDWFREKYRIFISVDYIHNKIVEPNEIQFVPNISMEIDDFEESFESLDHISNDYYKIFDFVLTEAFKLI